MEYEIIPVPTRILTSRDDIVEAVGDGYAVRGIQTGFSGQDPVPFLSFLRKHQRLVLHAGAH